MRKAKTLSHCAHTNVGKTREHNEDAYHIDEALGAYLVADGMGGQAAGEVASALAVKVAMEQLQAGSSLTSAIQAAHNEIIHQASTNPAQKGMGTTIVAVRRQRFYLELGWVGDSRIYQYCNHNLKQLSVDHSFVQDMVLRGVLTEEQARTHPDSALLRQALGKDDIERVRVDTLNLPLKHEGILMLCTDGVSDMLSHDQLRSIFAENTDLIGLGESLEKAVMATEADDNFTFIILKYRPTGLAKLMCKFVK